MHLIPTPRKMTLGEEKDFILRYNSRIVIGKACDLQITTHAKLLKKDIQQILGFSLEITKGERENGCIYLCLQKELQEEEYRLQISENMVEIFGGSNAGILYGIQTLRQMIENEGAIFPSIIIEDFPYMANRGFYHDITRGRIPTMESLKALADKLAYYKINQLQLYIEHSFLFKDFSEVWRDDTPLTAEDILELDIYCKNLHIDLIPSIASFGHLYKVLRTKTYSDLCELSGSEEEPFSLYERMAHHTLDISNEESFIFATKMIEEYILLFSSQYFNLCADETMDLGKGKSKKIADQIGLDNMYIGFLKRLCDYIIGKGKRPMFWGDIISEFPSAIKKLPSETICLNWGYAPDHSEDATIKLQQAGAVQYICPGVSGWNQLINRIKDSYDNISRKCTFGIKHKAIGVLNTDWGDFGHINHPEFSTTGMIYGAAFSWNEQIPEFGVINRQISRLEYGDYTETFLSIVSEIANKSEATWFEIVCYKELQDKSIKGTPYAPILKEISWEKVSEANSFLDEKIVEIYRIFSHAKTEKRHLYKAYLIATQGIKIWNEIGATVACKEDEECDEKSIRVRPKELAVQLEYWYHQYKELWRSVSKESELYRIGEIVFWYADYLREIDR